jgi:hypothetical protein
VGDLFRESYVIRIDSLRSVSKRKITTTTIRNSRFKNY